MKQILMLLFMSLSLVIYAQKTDLVTVNTVKPIKGQKMAFEAAYKVHVAKFHKATEKMNVYEILSGPYTGYYHLVNSGRSFADLDKDRADATAHSTDLDKTFFPLLEDTKNSTYRFVDSLSLRSQTAAEKFVVSIRHMNLKVNADDYKREMGRAVKINGLVKSNLFENLSYSFFDQLWDGSDQTVVSIRNLKEGFQALDPNFYAKAPEGSLNFRDEYIKAYGFDAWEARVKLMETAVDKTEQYIMKLRKDLSTQQ